MNASTKSAGIQTYQTVLYDRALHPELFALRSRRVVRCGQYELEAWVLRSAHVLRFEHDLVCASELVTDHDNLVPITGILSAAPCNGEHEYEHRFDDSRVVYMTAVQTETLPENVYMATLAEIREYAAERDSLMHEWMDEIGPGLSVVDIHRYAREVHAECYHFIPGGLVVRTQTLFEHDCIVQPSASGDIARNPQCEQRARDQRPGP